MIPEESLRDIAQNEREFYVTQDIEWPDCATVTQDIIEEIREHHCQEITHVVGSEFQINGKYYHYAAEITDEKSNSTAIIDASFSQFATEADTPISIGSIQNMNPVTITSPAESYIFYNEKTSEHNALQRI